MRSKQLSSVVQYKRDMSRMQGSMRAAGVAARVCVDGGREAGQVRAQEQGRTAGEAPGKGAHVLL